MILCAKTGQITSLVQLLEQQLVLVRLELLQLEAQGHQQRLELLLPEQRPVRLLHSHHLHNQCLRHMLNRSLVCRSCCHMMNHS